ncbi:unnamed protein product [Bemisia tabaci]|uniref:ER-bound oxygenase mpaB/mpaB'/Rubber oxygenase catalytic domain-containing protein n=1 Tax=Bemisia tabaci TaxID=7038 RepID=A0A9P0F5E1_BEMTA|nr:unnamed protein product [Bemisia tabaci]
MTIKTEAESAFKEPGYASSEEGESLCALRDPRKDADPSKGKNDSGFNSSDDNLSSTSDTNSVSSTDSPSSDRITSPITAHLPEEVLASLPDGAAEFLKLIRDGTKVGLPDSFQVPIEDVPSWFDKKKYQLGRQFGHKYYFGINFAEMVSLYLLFLPDRTLEPLIFTGNSHTPYKAFKRYLSTGLRVKSWIDCDIFDTESVGYKNLRTVRAMHLNASRKLNGCPREEIARRGTMAGEPGREGVWCPSYQGIRKDLAGTCPFAGFDEAFKMELQDAEATRLYFSQTDMSITQFGFVGLVLLYPGKFGAGSATDEELEGFAHLWRCIGYLLGIEDRFNFCQGTLAEIRQRTAYTLDFLIKPRFKDAGPDWEHMSRCMVEGISYYIPGVTFEVSLSYMCWALDIQIPSVSTKLTVVQNFFFGLTKLFFCHTSRIPAVLRFHNYLLRNALQKVQKQPREWHEKLESKKYDYQKTGGRDHFAQIGNELPVLS